MTKYPATILSIWIVVEVILAVISPIASLYAMLGTLVCASVGCMIAAVYCEWQANRCDRDDWQ